MNDLFRARAGGHDETDVADISEMARSAFAALRRNLWIVVASAVLFAGLAAIYTIGRSAEYVAQAALMIDPRVGDGIGGSQAPTIFLADALVVDSEIKVLQSERLLRRVAERLPEPPFEPGAAEDSDGGAPTPGPIDRLSALFGGAETEAEEVPLSEEELLAEKADWVGRNLDVEREGTTFVISLQFRASSAGLAATVANLVAEQYLAIQANDKVARASQATAWLRGELDRLSNEMRAAEAETQRFIAENRIPLEGEDDAVRGALSEVEVDAIAVRRLVREASSELQSIELDLSRLDAAEEIGSLLSIALADADLGGLQEQLRSAQSRIANDSGAASAERLLDLVVAQIRSELVRLRDTRDARIEVANANLVSLDAERSQLQAEIARINEARIELGALERTVQTLARQHEALALELQQSESEDRFTASSTTRIIDRATPPGEPANGSGVELLIAAALGGAIMGCGIVLLREQLDDRIRGSKDVTETLGFRYMGPIPRYRRGDLKTASAEPFFSAGDRSQQKRQALGRLVAGARSGPPLFLETLRRAGLAVREPFDAGPRCTLVTSPAKQDGKTTLTTNLAVFLADRGTNVLLVDGDPYMRTLSRLVAPEARCGGEECVEAESLVQVTQLNAKLTLLRAHPGLRGVDPTSYAMALRRVIAERGDLGEVVLIDAPPLATTVEELIEMPEVAQVFLVARFGRTSASALRTALRQRPGIAKKIAGVFISHVKESALRHYEPFLSYNDYGGPKRRPPFVRG